MISEVKMPVVAWQYRSEDPFDCGQLMLSEEEPARREKAPLVLQSDALAAIEAARVEARAKALEEAAAEFDRRDNGCGYYEPGEPAEIVRSLAKEAP